MGSLVQILGLFCLVCFSFFVVNTVSESVKKGSVVIDGSSVIGNIDDDFVCATLDWWPPQKCDYGTCSWGLASLLNLVYSSSFSFSFFKSFLLQICLERVLECLLICLMMFFFGFWE